MVKTSSYYSPTLPSSFFFDLSAFIRSRCLFTPHRTTAPPFFFLFLGILSLASYVVYHAFLSALLLGDGPLFCLYAPFFLQRHLPSPLSVSVGYRTIVFTHNPISPCEQLSAEGIG